MGNKESQNQVPSKKLTIAFLIVGLLLWGAWFAVGIPSRLGSPYLGVLLFLCLVLSRRYKKWGPRWAKLTLLWLFLGGSILAADLGLRVFAWHLIQPLPQSRWFREWPENPDLYRYEPLKKFSGESFGDLASMIPGTSYRQNRQVEFETDEVGCG